MKKGEMYLSDGWINYGLIGPKFYRVNLEVRKWKKEFVNPYSSYLMLPHRLFETRIWSADWLTDLTAWYCLLLPTGLPFIPSEVWYMTTKSVLTRERGFLSLIFGDQWTKFLTWGDSQILCKILMSFLCGATPGESWVTHRSCKLLVSNFISFCWIWIRWEGKKPL